MTSYQRYRGNFADCLKELTKANQKFALPAEGMKERMKQGVRADISTGGAWYNASFNEVQGRILATREEYNPLTAYSREAVKAMRNGEFYLDGVLINERPTSEVLAEIAEQDAKKPIHKRRVADFGQMQTHNVQTDCFGDDNVIIFLAEGKERANRYGLWLKNKAGIPDLTVYMQNLIGKSKSRGFWLGRLGGNGGSDFSCDDRDRGDGSLFGVSESAEGTAKNFAIYTQEQGEKYLKVLKGVRSGILPNSELEDIIHFFEQ